MRWQLGLAGLGMARVAGAVAYERTLSYVGQDFFEPFRWSFHTAEDPTHGAVDYVDYDTAASAGLINATFDRVFMGVDTSTVIRSAGGGSRRRGGPRGRRSVRIMSRRTFNGGLFVLELDHMPTGCGVWPAFWMYGEDPKHPWPTLGEFDIIEGAHTSTRTMTTLHTNKGCDQSRLVQGRLFTGRWLPGLDGAADNCDVKAAGQWGNQGCSQAGPESSMGEPFNARGGGTFAAEWDPEGGHFRTWFFPAATGLPPDLMEHQPRPDMWGRPYSYFRISSPSCSKDHFRNMRIVFDTTFCGDLGAPTFSQACPKVAQRMTCEEFVERHPENFTEAYWSIRGLDVYQKAESTLDLRDPEVPAEPDQDLVAAVRAVLGGLRQDQDAEAASTAIAEATTTSEAALPTTTTGFSIPPNALVAAPVPPAPPAAAATPPTEAPSPAALELPPWYRTPAAPVGSNLGAGDDAMPLGSAMMPYHPRYVAAIVAKSGPARGADAAVLTARRRSASLLLGWAAFLLVASLALSTGFWRRLCCDPMWHLRACPIGLGRSAPFDRGLRYEELPLGWGLCLEQRGLTSPGVLRASRGEPP